MKINKIIFSILFLLIGVFIGVKLASTVQKLNKGATAETIIYIAPTSQSKNLGASFDFSVKIDTGANAITGVDINLNFDPHALEVISLQAGSGISDLSSLIYSRFDNSAGTIGFATYTVDRNKTVSGSGIEILKINAKVKNNAVLGTYPITFDVKTAASGRNEVINVIANMTNGNLIVTENVGGPEGAPNFCGGTCGSNNNCQVNYFCYQGFCRKPECADSSDCNCQTKTPTSTVTPTKKPTLTPKPTLEVIVLSPMPKYTPKATLTPRPTYQPVTTRTAGINYNYLLWIAGGSFIMAILLIAYSKASK